jgi:sugar lactone lactonase YvrE
MAGCAGRSVSTVQNATVEVSGLGGSVHGGIQAISGASIQLYQVGSTGDGSAANSLMTTTVTSSDGTGQMNANANTGNKNNTLPAGGFTLVNTFQCPTSGPTTVYLAATGGDPGLTGSAVNSDIAFVSVLGDCANLAAVGHIALNEASTLGTVAAMYPYIGAPTSSASSVTQIGYGPSDASQFLAAVALVPEYVNVSTGNAPGPNLPANYYASTTELYSLANVLAACINSPGGANGTGSDCGQLLSLATPLGSNAAQDTVTAAAYILKNPSLNTARIFQLVSGNPPFQPSLQNAPASFALPILPMAATPALSLASGTYTGAQSLTISDSTTNATIYYTTDGTTPTNNSTVYTGSAIPLSASETVKAIAYAQPTYAPSSVATGAYVVTNTVAPPAFSPAPGTYDTPQNVSITTTATNATIYYTTDGSTPTTASTSYGGQIYVGSNETLNAIAVVGGLPNSTVSTGGYVINAAADNDVLSSIAGAGGSLYYDGGAATSVALNPRGVAVDSIGEVFIADTAKNVIRKIGTNGLISTYAGSGSTTCNNLGNCDAGGVALSASLYYPQGLAVDSSNNLYIADTDHGLVRKVTPAGVISTIAGGGGSGTANGVSATSVALTDPSSLAFDSNGNLYIGESEFSSVSQGTRVLKVANGIITTVAGGGTAAVTNGASATAVAINGAQSIAIDSSNNLYIAAVFGNGTYGNNPNATVGSVIYQVTSGGTISIYAGSQTAAGYNGDGFAAPSTLLSNPTALTTDTGGDLYFADITVVSNGPGDPVIRKINPSGIVSTVAGGQDFGGTYSSTFCSSNPNVAIHTVLGQTTQMFFYPSAGAVYLAEAGGGCVGKLVFSTPSALNVVAQPVFTPNQNAGPFTSEPTITLSSATAGATIAYTTDGTVPNGGSHIYSSSSPIIPTATTNIIAYAFKSGLTPSALASGDYVLNLPTVATPGFSITPGTYTTVQTVAVSDATSGAAIYCTTDNSTPTTSSPQYVTGTPFTLSTSTTIKCIAALAGDANSAVATGGYTINLPTAAAPVFSLSASPTYSSSQTVTITSSSTATGAVIYYTTDGTTPTTASPVYTGQLTLSRTTYLQAIAAGTNFITSTVTAARYLFNYGTTGGIINELVGGSYYGPSFPAAAVNPNGSYVPYASAVDQYGNVYISGSSCYTNYSSYPYVTTCTGLIYKVNPAGAISIFAGGGTGSEATGGSATTISLAAPKGIATDLSGNIYFADSTRICKITQAGVLSLIAGGASAGTTGNGGLATSATVNPTGALTVYGTGDIYFVDSSNSIRKIAASNSYISLYAGSSSNSGFSGDTGLATAAVFNQITALATDINGNLYLTDFGNYRIREVTASTGKVNTIAGNGYPSSGNSSGDGALATAAYFKAPQGLAVDPQGNVYVGDYGEIHVISPATLKITAFLGNGTPLTHTSSGGSVPYPAGDGGTIASASVYNPSALTQDQSGSLYITDSYFQDVREVSFGAQPTVATPAPSLGAGTYNGAQTVTLTTTTPNAAIYYGTTSPITPGNGNAILYTGPIAVPSSETLYYAAFLAGNNGSVTGSTTYTLILPQDPAPTIGSASGNYSSSFHVYISPSGTTTSTEQIYYTVDGTTPTTSSPYIYQGGQVIISGTTTLKAISTASGYTNSPVVTATYTFPTPTVAAPVFTSTNPPTILSGTGQENTYINCTSATSGATVYYTVAYGGATPATPTRTSSQWYPQNLAFGTNYSMTITAIAYYNGVYSLPVTATFYDYYP